MKAINDVFRADIKVSNGKHHSDMKAMNDHISGMNGHIFYMLEKFNDTSAKTNEQDDKIIYLSSKQSEIVQNELLNITSEHPYSEDNFESKFQAKLSSSNQFFEQPAEELVDFKVEQQMEPNKFSS